MAAANVLQGTDLCLFISSGGTKKCIALATSCKISVNMATKKISSKDSVGNWEESSAGRLSWTVDSDNLFTQDYNSLAGSASGYSYAHLVDAMIARTALTIYVGAVTTAQAGYPQSLGTSYKSLSGTAYITKLDLNAPNDESATFTVSLEGSGALTHATAS